MRRWYEALRSADTAVLGTLVGGQFVNHGPVGAGVPLSSGRDGLGDDVLSLHRSFPDIDVVVADMFAEHDKVVTRVIARGTHLGRTGRSQRGVRGAGPGPRPGRSLRHAWPGKQRRHGVVIRGD